MADRAATAATLVGRGALMRDSKGLRDIAALLAHSGEAVHATELLAATSGEPGARDGAGAAVTLDGRARREYRTRLDELEAEIDEADAAHDPERATRARVERDFLLTELTSALGLGGRSRRLGDPAERARKAVGERIRLTLDRMDQIHPELANHLRHSLRTGTFCSYEPEQAVNWQR